MSEGEEEVLVDAERMVAGRLASIIAKLLLQGKRVLVFNVEKAVITGKRSRVVDWYRKKLVIQSKVNPRRYGPFTPRTPDGIFRRMVRGMLPRRKPKGKEAYRRLRVFIGVPSEFSGNDLVRFQEAEYRKSPYGFVTLEELSRIFGWKPIEERAGGA